VAVHNEHLAIWKSYRRFLPFVSVVLPLCVFLAARLSFCISLLAVPSPRPASPARLHAVHLRQSSDISLSCTFPSAITGTRSLFWQNGQPLLVLCSPALLVQKCLSCASSEHCRHPLTTAENSRCRTASSHSCFELLFIFKKNQRPSFFSF
jgi:hypothetical protein